MKYLVLQHHHQNIQMLTHNNTLKYMIPYTGVTVTVHTSDDPDIPYLTKMSTTSASNETHQPIYGYLNRPLLIQNKLKNKTFQYNK